MKDRKGEKHSSVQTAIYTRDFYSVHNMGFDPHCISVQHFPRNGCAISLCLYYVLCQNGETPGLIYSRGGGVSVVVGAGEGSQEGRSSMIF